MSINAEAIAGIAPPLQEQSYEVEPTQLRQVFGRFPTGVTIVTTNDTDGSPVGMTVSSFNTVSLDPPLILWCIDKKTGCFEAFDQCSEFAVHVLSEQQQDVSSLFAKRGVDKFAQAAYHHSDSGIPLLEEFCARLQCSVAHRYEGGDHVIIVGRVEKMHTQESGPLVFHGGRYASIA